MTENGKLVRLYPVPFRLVADDQQFRKWQWIEARVEKANADHRPESHRLFVDTVECDPEPLRAGKEGWPRRMQLLSQLTVFDDFSTIQAARIENGTSLALLRPSRILGLDISPAKSTEWTTAEKEKLLQLQSQGNLFDGDEESKHIRLLEKLPFDFHYRYECIVDGEVRSYRHKIVDWEAGALFRNLRRKLGASGWEAPFREKYERELPARDLLLLLGTIHRFPDQWLAVSVICPPRPQAGQQHQESLF
ncbi:hypothetical protein [Hydrogenophaga laconesensis]|uniref:Uncharacterized protein n=1 Tax=Hydrogenophaga laconesensis TaxID=1805971 RepID=A0ABU1VGI7_9BURK|nr:hypothetical protein [Hydrogenophaga laconesensis]MDR7096580.1 hypothetical protein [Hydrogenophaga laconesensis]